MEPKSSLFYKRYGQIILAVMLLILVLFLVTDHVTIALGYTMGALIGMFLMIINEASEHAEAREREHAGTVPVVK